jgi:hypothetical protein
MNKLKFVITLAAIASFVSYGNTATIQIYGSASPNNSSSPATTTYTDYAANAIQSVVYGASEGDRNIDPSAFTTTNAVVPSDIITTTGTNSWRGDFAPTGAFANEQGGRLTIIIDIVKTGLQLNLADLSVTRSSADAAFNVTNTYVSFDGLTRFGLNYGADGVRGGVDDVLITSGNSLVDEIIIFTRSSYSWGGNFANQEAYVEANTGFVKADVTFGSDSGSKTINVIPEPSTYVLLALGTLALVGVRRLNVNRCRTK